MRSHSHVSCLYALVDLTLSFLPPMEVIPTPSPQRITPTTCESKDDIHQLHTQVWSFSLRVYPSSRSNIASTFPQATFTLPLTSFLNSSTLLFSPHHLQLANCLLSTRSTKRTATRTCGEGSSWKRICVARDIRTTSLGQGVRRRWELDQRRKEEMLGPRLLNGTRSSMTREG